MEKPSKNRADQKRQPAHAVHQGPDAPATLAGHHLILVLYANEFSAWQAASGGKPEPLEIKGEKRLSVSSKDKLASALADIDERLRGDGVVVQHTHWIADAAGRSWCADCATKASSSGNWQLLSWEWLAARFGLGPTSSREAGETLTNLVLPWLISADDAAQRQHLLRARQHEHLSESDRLTSERKILENQNQHLRDQNAALGQVELERLVCYLPALFHRVFTILGPTDVALLCGRVEPPDLPNPYPEPSEETLRTLQKRFRELPQALQRQIVGFVAALPQRQKLDPRTEMRELMHELEG